MSKKLYNTYLIGDKYTLFEIDKKTIKNKEYLLLLQKEKPNLIVVGFFKDGKLEIIDNEVLAGEIVKVFMADEKGFYEKLLPFIKIEKN